MGSYLYKDGRHHVDLPFAGIVVYKLLAVIIVCVCGGMYALYRKRKNGSAVGQLSELRVDCYNIHNSS